MPSNEIARQLIALSNVPIVAPSANISGKPSGTNLEDIKEELDGKVDAMIDGGETQIGIESTVVKVIDNVPTILRPGKITPEDIINVVGTCKINDKVMSKVEKDEKVESPGMKYRHYAPNTECILVCSKTEEKQIEKINHIIKMYEDKNMSLCVIGFDEHESKIKIKDYISMGSINNLEEISRKIYSALRKADKLDKELIIIEGTSQEGLGLAIKNRLIRTCEYKVYDVD
jgi:L-threonylcarbamoyladenylate synthase